MRSVVAVVAAAAAALSLAAWCSGSPGELSGLYRAADGRLLVLFPAWTSKDMTIAADGRTGEVRGLFPGATAGSLTYGPSLGVTEPRQGAVTVERDSAGAVIGLERAPVSGPSEKFARVPVRREPVKFENGAVTLAGEVVLPEGDGPFPGVVMLHGSDPQPREGNLGMAMLFASQGIASLIFDKRGVGESVAPDWRASFDEYAGDARAGFDALRAHAGIDPGRVGYWGHSQGAWIAALAGSRTKDAAFVVLECGGAIDVVETTLWWGEQLLRATADFTPEQIADLSDYRRKKFAVAAGRMRLEELAPFTEAARAEPWFPRVTDQIPGGPFWKGNAGYDPVPALEGLVHCPVLAIYAEHDDSTPSGPSVETFSAAMRRSGHTRATVRLIPDANHGLFETKTGKRMDEELAALQRFAPEYVPLLLGWLKEVTAE